MKLLIRKDFEAGKGTLKKGDVVNVTPLAGNRWIKDKLAKEIK